MKICNISYFTEFPIELVMYIAEMIIHVKTETAYQMYIDEKYQEGGFELMNSLENRFVNGVVSYRLAYMFKGGKGIEKSPEKAQYFFRNSFNLLVNSAYSSLEYFYVGAMYKDGNGIEKDDLQALKYYEIASKLGHAKAQINLGCCYRDGEGVPVNKEKAFYYYQQAADQKNPLGMCHVAYMMEFGYGTRRNETEAIRLYQISAKKGIQYSIDRLKTLKMDIDNDQT